MSRYLALVLLLLSSSGLWAATIVVGTTNDVVDAGDCSTLTIPGLAASSGNDGQISLREAVCAANASAGADTIQLTAGVYSLSLGAAGESLNEAGDLDVLESLSIIGAGPADTFIDNAVGDPMVAGDGDRIIEVGPGGLGGIDFVLQDLTLRGGDVSCDGIGCQTGAGALHYDSDGVFHLLRAGIDGAQTQCTGGCCGHRNNVAGIAARSPSDLIMEDTFVRNTLSSCTENSEPACMDTEFYSCIAGPGVLLVGDNEFGINAMNVRIHNTVFSENQVLCEGTPCGGEEMVIFSNNIDEINAEITNFSMTNNRIHCAGFDCDTDEMFQMNSDVVQGTFTNWLFENNELSCDGESCNGDEMISINGSTAVDIVFSDSQIINNDTHCVGFDCDTDEFFQSDNDGDKILRNILVANNQQSCTGGECDTDEVLSTCCSPGHKLLDRLRFIGNHRFCDGDGCDTQGTLVVGANGNDAGQTVTVRNTIITDNQANCNGANCGCDAGGIRFSGDSTAHFLIGSSVFANQSIGDDVPDGDQLCARRSTGGILNETDNLTIINTTLADGVAVGSGAALVNYGTVRLRHVTITGNEANQDQDGVGMGGGICNNQVVDGNASCSGETGSSEADAVLIMSNTVIADNTDHGSAANCSGAVTSERFNVLSDAVGCQIDDEFDVLPPLLGALQDNGCNAPQGDGSCVPTRMPLAGSPLIDKGSCRDDSIGFDQRGFFRPFDDPNEIDRDDACDIGAVEVNPDHIFADSLEA